MGDESVFRVAFALILASTMFISGFHRSRARKAGPVIARKAEGAGLIALRFLFAFPLFLLLLLYIVRPQWVAWAHLELPTWIRWCGVALAAATLPFTLWVFRSIGSSISETILTKEGQRLVTWGPYRWIRHPLYSGACVTLAALSLVAANGAMGLLTLLVMAALPFLARREEQHLLQRFGPAYAEYMARSGRFFPGVGATPTRAP